VITSGLEGGEEIVTNGAFTVDAAAQLQGKRSMMNPEIPSEDEQFRVNDLSKAVGDALKKVIPLYINLKDALVESDSEKTAQEAGKILTLLEGTLNQMKESLAALAESRSLEEQREEFRLLSEGLISLAKPLGSPENPLYLQYCPMANQNTGAYWLSQDSEIRNPYYGEAMLRCGEVRATWTGF
jgi:Cu(I)/Ag(I) efflux system membrane fusion protein